MQLVGRRTHRRVAPRSMLVTSLLTSPLVVTSLLVTPPVATSPAPATAASSASAARPSAESRQVAHVRTVTRTYGGPAVHLADRTDVLRLRFEGTRGDKVSLHWLDYARNVPVDSRNRSCTRLRLRSDRGSTTARPDELHALTVRRSGWQTLVYRMCDAQHRRPDKVRLMKWDVRRLQLDGASRPYTVRGGHLAAYTVEARAGDWIHLLTDEVPGPPHVGTSRPDFSSDVPDHLVREDGTYTFVEQPYTRRYEPVTAQVRARRMQALPPLRPGEATTFTADGSGRWVVAEISLDGPHQLRATDSTLVPAGTWSAEMHLHPPRRCPIWGPLGCGDGTFTGVDATGTYGWGGVGAGAYRLFFRPGLGATGSIELAVVPHP